MITSSKIEQRPDPITGRPEALQKSSLGRDRPMFAATGSTMTQAMSSRGAASALNQRRRCPLRLRWSRRRIRQRQASRHRFRPRPTARRCGRDNSRRTSRSSTFPYEPRASRIAVIAASVPDETRRTMSAPGGHRRAPRRDHLVLGRCPKGRARKGRIMDGTDDIVGGRGRGSTCPRTARSRDIGFRRRR